MHKVHIQVFDRTGNPKRSEDGFMVALCRSDQCFDRSINAPFKLGRRVCEHCEKIAANLESE